MVYVTFLSDCVTWAILNCFNNWQISDQWIPFEKNWFVFYLPVMRVTECLYKMDLVHGDLSWSSLECSFDWIDFNIVSWKMSYITPADYNFVGSPFVDGPYLPANLHSYFLDLSNIKWINPYANFQAFSELNYKYKFDIMVSDGIYKKKIIPFLSSCWNQSTLKTGPLSVMKLCWKALG